MNAETNIGYDAPVINFDIGKYVPEFILNRYCLNKAKLSYRSDTLLRQGISVPRTSGYELTVYVDAPVLP